MLCHCDFRSYRFIYRPSGLLGLLFHSHVAPLPFVCNSGCVRVYLITRKFVTLVYTRAGRTSGYMMPLVPPGLQLGGMEYISLVIL